MYDPDETPCDRDETPFDGGRETRRIGAALDRTIRTMRRLLIMLTLGLTIQLGLSLWILLRLR